MHASKCLMEIHGRAPWANAMAGLLSALFNRLEESQLSWCVLHGYDRLPEEITSDVDCLVAPEALSARLGQIKNIIQSLCTDTNAVLVQWIQHEATAHYFVFASKTENGHWEFLRFDVSSDYRRNGRIFYSGEEILNHRRRFNGFWVPAPRHEFGYYLVKKIAKGQLGSEHGERLSHLYHEDPIGCAKEIRKFWREDSARLLEHAAESRDWALVQASIAQLRSELLRTTAARNPVATVRYVAGEVLRVGRRWRYPTGLWIAILGPDGSGKSTVAETVRERIKPAFRRTAQFHFLPRLLRRKAAGHIVTDPHGQAPRSSVASLAKVAYWLADSVAGYAFVIRPALVRSTLVVFDRCVLDAVVDPKRYRYNGPSWLVRLLWKTIPKPDVVILLDAPVEILHQRKQEVTWEESERQRAAYRALVERMPNGHIVDASRPLPEVVADIEDIIIRHMADRTARRLGLEKPA